MSGPAAEHGKLCLNAVLLCFREVNEQGGIAGHPVQVVPYDDKDDAKLAVERAKEVAASPAVAVIGHFSSSATVPAGPIYKATHLPALTGLSAAPAVTDNNPYYFRVTMDASSQGHTLAAYAKNVLKKNRASVLYSNEIYGKAAFASFADEYADQGGILETGWAWNPKAGEQEHAAFIQRVSEDIANGDGAIVILITAPYSAAQEALKLLRRSRVNPVVLAGTSGSDFPQLFRDEPEEKLEPGYFTNNTYIASPVLYDSAPERALAFQDRFDKTFHSYPNERSAQHYDAALVLAQALRQGGLQYTSQSRDSDRERIRTWLSAQKDPSKAITGLSGPISQCAPIHQTGTKHSRIFQT